MAFRGFGPNALPFLKALAFHQTRNGSRPTATYESDLKSPMGDLVEDFPRPSPRRRFRSRATARSSLFRIHRDVRFSKDKSPYKTNVGAVMTRSGGKSDAGAVLHACRARTAASPPPASTNPSRRRSRRLRAAMARAPKGVETDPRQTRKEGLTPSTEYALKRNPRGFEDVSDAQVVAGLAAQVDYRAAADPGRALAESGLVGELVAFARDALPLLDLGLGRAHRRAMRRYRVAPAADAVHIKDDNQSERRTMLDIPTPPAGDYATVRRALEFVTKRWRDQPSVEAIADHVGLSTSHLQFVFKRWAGLTPKAFLQAITIERARELLRDSATVLDASYEVGLSGPGRLHDLFVTHERLTPGDYRRDDLTLRYGFHNSPFGEAIVVAAPRGLAGLGFVDDGDREAALADMRRRWPRAQFEPDDAATAPLARRAFEPTAMAARRAAARS